MISAGKGIIMGCKTCMNQKTLLTCARRVRRERRVMKLCVLFDFILCKAHAKIKKPSTCLFVACHGCLTLYSAFYSVISIPLFSLSRLMLQKK